ncbi:MAG TPA: glycosyltransferase family 4 protein [Thermoanaerobaculia bacterium]|nr:glycosyltransferase family 4 protein [Thermoanaerobaculia bacterium]
MSDVIYGESPPWVIVAGGFHREGGMDKANAALAWHLVSHGARVQLVGHSFESELAAHPLVSTHLVTRPRESFLLGERLLDRKGSAVADAVRRDDPRTRIVVNGGNCAWPGINWVHYVHHAWHPPPGLGVEGLKNRISGRYFRRSELRALSKAELILANSEKTRADLIALPGILKDRVETLYLGSDPSWNVPGPADRAKARRAFDIPGDRPVVVFVGAISSDGRKGFDTLWQAWRLLCEDPQWDGELLVAGGGRTIDAWREKSVRAGIGERIRFLGFIRNVDELLAAADLLVSPARYEPYGLNVQEAICRGVPSIVTSSAGAAEKYPEWARPLLLADPDDAGALAGVIRSWRASMPFWRSKFATLGEDFRRYTWDGMAAELVRMVNERFR